MMNSVPAEHWGQWLLGFSILREGSKPASLWPAAFVNIDQDRQDRASVAVSHRGLYWVGETSFSRTVDGNNEIWTFENPSMSAVPSGFPVAQIPRKVTVVLTVSTEAGVSGTWRADSGLGGNVKGGNFSQPVSLKATHTMRWSEFRNAALGGAIHVPNSIYRGHTSNRYELQTTLARRGRLNLHRYLMETLPEAALRTEASLGMRFNTLVYRDQLTLISLARHHGFPTPILDWTRSPFVAAYFAFERSQASAMADNTEHVRIFRLHPNFRPHWRAPTLSVEPNPLLEPGPFCAVVPIPTLHNPRALPQQAVAVCTNMFDAGAFLNYGEPLKDKLPQETNLAVIDLPMSDREEALRDLRLMGVTRDSLFPGLDGMFVGLTDELF